MKRAVGLLCLLAGLGVASFELPQIARCASRVPAAGAWTVTLQKGAWAGCWELTQDTPPPPKTECENGQSGRECITSETCTQIGGAGCVCVGAEIRLGPDGQVEEIVRGQCEFLGRGTAAL